MSVYGRVQTVRHVGFGPHRTTFFSFFIQEPSPSIICMCLDNLRDMDMRMGKQGLKANSLGHRPNMSVDI